MYFFPDFTEELFYTQKKDGPASENAVPSVHETSLCFMYT